MCVWLTGCCPCCCCCCCCCLQTNNHQLVGRAGGAGRRPAGWQVPAGQPGAQAVHLCRPQGGVCGSVHGCGCVSAAAAAWAIVLHHPPSPYPPPVPPRTTHHAPPPLVTQVAAVIEGKNRNVTFHVDIKDGGRARRRCWLGGRWARVAIFFVSGTLVCLICTADLKTTANQTHNQTKPTKPTKPRSLLPLLCLLRAGHPRVPGAGRHPVQPGGRRGRRQAALPQRGGGGAHGRLLGACVSVCWCWLITAAAMMGWWWWDGGGVPRRCGVSAVAPPSHQLTP
jgi:hypothetical protein